MILANAAALITLDAFCDIPDIGGAGTLVIYDGTPPADTDTALSGNTVLVTFTLANPAFGAAVDIAPGARATANAIASATATATGTATFARMFAGLGIVTTQFAVTATGGGGPVELDDIDVVTSDSVSVTSFTITLPES